MSTHQSTRLSRTVLFSFLALFTSLSVQAVPTGTARPIIQSSASPTAVAPGQATRLTWSARGATSCQASGSDDWNGKLSTRGSRTVRPTSTATYQIACTGPGGAARDSITVRVTGSAAPAQAPDPAEGTGQGPALSFRASDTIVESGGYTTLHWSAADASGCVADGGWRGNRRARGTEVVGPIDAQQIFSLSCTGSGGTTGAMIAVTVQDSVAIRWRAPTRNVDGSRLTDLAGYRIYYGSSSGQYSEVLHLDAADKVKHTLTLQAGTWYFAMTAVDSEGNESRYSNEVVRAVGSS